MILNYYKIGLYDSNEVEVATMLVLAHKISKVGDEIWLFNGDTAVVRLKAAHSKLLIKNNQVDVSWEKEYEFFKN